MRDRETHTDNPSEMATRADGVVPDTGRQCDIQAIQDLAIAYGHAVDDRDWSRWQALFTPDAHIDYTSAGGIAGTPAELTMWFPDAFAVFEWCMHSMSTHEITFTDDNRATGRVHVFNRNGVTHDDTSEILDVGAVYEDTYVCRDGAWRFSSRIEHVRYIDGGGFAAMLKDALQM
jgi:hypothetical protein